MELELERGHDTEVAAAAPDSPEEVGVLRRADSKKLTRGGHDLCRQQVVAGQPVLPPDPADATSQCQSRHPSVGDDTGRGRQPENLSGTVEIAQCCTTVYTSGLLCRVHLNASHPSQVDHQATLGHSLARDIVAAGTYRDEKVVIPGKRHCADHVGRAGAVDDE